ncbi:MAG: CoA pyrophosphatase [Gemmatimonadota bacterium]|nr:CoA pyrophosphatase [Gemmatimonadota bacterium]
MPSRPECEKPHCKGALRDFFRGEAHIPSRDRQSSGPSRASHDEAAARRLTRLRDRLADQHPATVDDDSLIWAAVAVVITPDPDSILLIRRADRMGDPWSGHMALPGGRREPADLELLATAIREAHEEVGLELERQHLLGSLEDVVPRTPVLPPVAVRPFVFLSPSRPPLVLNFEVASARWVALDELLRPEARRSVRLEVAGQSREVQAFQLENAIIWGMTERILTDLLQQLSD